MPDLVHDEALLLQTRWRRFRSAAGSWSVFSSSFVPIPLCWWALFASDRIVDTLTSWSNSLVQYTRPEVLKPPLSGFSACSRQRIYSGPNYCRCWKHTLSQRCQRSEFTAFDYLFRRLGNRPSTAEPFISGQLQMPRNSCQRGTVNHGMVHSDTVCYFPIPPPDCIARLPSTELSTGG